MLQLLFALLGILSLALSAPVDGTLSLPTHTASVNASTLDQHGRCDWSNTRNWQAYAFLVEDCFVAINDFFVKHVVRNPDEIFEFSASSSWRHTRYPRVRTPEVFTHGQYLFSSCLPKSRLRKGAHKFTSPESCTLVIVMLDWFTLGQLPGGSQFDYRPYDTSTSRALWKAAKKVEIECLAARWRKPGWEPAGDKRSIGVFLWATDSDINRQVTGRPSYGLTNGSSAGQFDTTAR